MTSRGFCNNLLQLQRPVENYALELKFVSKASSSSNGVEPFH